MKEKTPEINGPEDFGTPEGPPDWQEVWNNIKRLIRKRDALIDELLEQYSTREERFRVLSSIPDFEEFGSKLRESVPNALSYIAFHALASSTTTYEESPEKDLEGEHSIENFLREEIKRVEAMLPASN